MSDFESMLEQTYRGFLNDGDKCVDAGAHEGRHTVPIAQCCGPSGFVLAFEPIPALATELARRVSRASGTPSIRVEQAALSDEVGEVGFVLVREAPGYSGLRARTYDHPVTTEEIRVRVRKLDEFRSELAGLRYIKIDCEGGEYGVLRGAREVISENRPIVSFECGDASLVNYPHSSGDLFDFFDALSYRIVSIEGEQLDRNEFINASTRQRFWDYLAYPA
ncbi:FkbM family methyltransferase [Pseudoxanthomonas daejeonensis]|uniref:FkbM family methyltransferase n=1 Tax=Pseudoxanthomonas daejeonensis TaxID=266062 RepID=UPI001F54507E|nr:FkbM family methyltransferase [Pseudoxanthomonas daejeonensis]UNK56442.1 FkbM family methyltransferase [Pseudoxanthomonas daejeonensis]